jgi:peptidyl-prolyl cis-trans isomerase B (cyclophilin B)
MIKRKIFIATLLSLLLLSSAAIAQPFTGKPTYQILTKRAGTYLGTINVELFPNIAPLAVHNFDSLVGQHFYDTTAFHRVIPGFMIQGGDPNSRHGPISTWGYGDPSQPTVNAEFSAAKHIRGTLSAARDTSINSANSQFFICVAPASWLDGQYSIYGHVTSGMSVVDTIVNSPRDANDNPLQKIEMFVTYIGSNDTVPNAPALVTPLSGSLVASPAKTLKWAAVSDAIIYHLDVSTDSLFTTLFKSIDVATLTNVVTGMTGGTTYYWRVRTNNGGHFSSYSSTWHFRITSTGVESYDETPKIIVSPNPGNGLFTFSNLEKDNTIQILDIAGRVIYTGVSKNDVCIVNLSEKAKGVYFYRVTNEKKEIQQGKLIFE